MLVANGPCGMTAGAARAVPSGGWAPSRLDVPESCPPVMIMALATSASAFLISSMSLDSWTRPRLRLTLTTAIASAGAAKME
eukprot:1563164-Amphidinium_carterae.1